MRKALIAASVLSLALTLGACGDDGGKSGDATNGGTSAPASGPQFNDAQSLLDAAKEGTQDAKTAKFSMEGTGVKASGEGVFDGANTKMAMTMAASGQEIEMRMIGTDLYMKGMPGADPKKPWAKMSMEGMPGADQLENSDPTKTLEHLLAAGAEIDKKEETELNGEKVTHYSLTVDVQKMMEQMGGGEAGATPPPGQEKMPVELYLNSDNQPVQIEMDMGGQGSMKMNFTDWGTDVKVEAPPEDEVAEMKPGATPN
ncbi:MAG: hypothetical protein GEU86_18580 [Actinophytocola sp.]|nr:hypothetical protein [Actinophytocola sp.]